MEEAAKIARFEEVLLRHLPAAYNLARWLVRNHHDAEDLVQEAYLRAFAAFEGFRGGGDGRAWLLTIVRNTCYTRLKQDRVGELTEIFDEEIHTAEADSTSPEALLLEQADAGLLREALEDLPPEFREAIVLRELEGMSYKEIADVASVPVGTVMSRLARGRERLQQRVAGVRKKEGLRGDLPKR